jgi:hypothetical protein
VRTRAQMCEMAVRDHVAGLHGERPKNLLNPEVLSR